MSKSTLSTRDPCGISNEKQRLDEVFFQLDDYYYELKERLIDLINQNIFDKDVEYFLIKMLKLDDSSNSEFNLIDYIQQLKKLNDELFANHRNACGSDIVPKLLVKIDKLNEKVKQLQEEAESYKTKIDKLTKDIEKANKANVRFENLNINYTSNPYYSDKLFINDLTSAATKDSNRAYNLSTSKSNIKTIDYFNYDGYSRQAQKYQFDLSNYYTNASGNGTIKTSTINNEDVFNSELTNENKNSLEASIAFKHNYGNSTSKSVLSGITNNKIFEQLCNSKGSKGTSIMNRNTHSRDLSNVSSTQKIKQQTISSKVSIYYLIITIRKLMYQENQTRTATHQHC